MGNPSWTALLVYTTQSGESPCVVLDQSLKLGTTVIGHQAAFYDFVPFRYGPFSFSFYEELLRDVYARYPWFATKSELEHLKPTVKAPPARTKLAVYTVGYEGKSVDQFFNGLLQAGMEAILDVRANPISRKYGFAKKSMSEIARKLGICYHHLPELGIASSERAGLSDFASYQRLLDRHEREMLPGRRAAIEVAVAHLQERPSTLLCMEKDVRCCHRGRLAKAVTSKNGREMVHLP